MKGLIIGGLFATEIIGGLIFGGAYRNFMVYSVTGFQITFKDCRVPTRSFDGSIDVSLPTPSQVSHLFCRVKWPAFSGF